MALAYDGAIQRLIDAFANLPGIGPKGAQRIAFYLLNASDEEAQTLIDAIAEIVYACKREGLRTTENEITRIAVNFIIAEYQAKGESSLLVKVLQALNA